MTTINRYDGTVRALEMHAKGKTYIQIGEALGITRQTASKWVNDGLALSAEAREHVKEKAIKVYEQIIKEAWERLETFSLSSTSHNVAGLLNTIANAQQRIDKLTGAEAPVKRELDVDDRRARVRDAVQELIAEAEGVTDPS